MNDYLNLPMDDDGGAADHFGGEGGSYLDLEDAPPMPAAADPFGASPDPYATTTGGYGDQGGYLESQPMGGFLTEEAPPAPHAPAAGAHTGDLSVQAPYLDEVQPSRSTVGGVPGDLSSLVLDVEVPVEVYFGDAALTVEDFLELGAGSVVELDHSIEMPIELRVRGKLIARGQLVTINGNYGLRVTDMVEQPS